MNSDPFSHFDTVSEDFHPLKPVEFRFFSPEEGGIQVTERNDFSSDNTGLGDHVGVRRNLEFLDENEGMIQLAR